MGTIPSAPAAAQGTAEHSWASGPAATLKRRWVAYVTWRIEQVAIAQLQSKCDLELIRRHSDGSIDFDFYRTRAVTLRGQARRDASALKAFGALVLTIMGVVAVFFAVAPAPPHASSDQAALTLTAPIR